MGPIKLPCVPDVVGKTLLLPDIKSYLSEINSRPGPCCKRQDFHFSSSSFSSYDLLVNRREGGSVYLPAACGKVAKAISGAGYHVHAGDPDPKQVAHLNSIGILAERKSFEALPKSKYDMIVCFEPYYATKFSIY